MKLKMQITQRDINFVKNSVKYLLGGTAEMVGIPMMGLYDLSDILGEMGWERCEMDGNETNGWQTDFWYSWVNPAVDKRLVVAGAVWQRGDRYKLYLDEKDTAEEDI